MQVVMAIFVLIIAYIIGSIPFGLVIVKLKTGQDIRAVQSGRTGGTNAMRAAGVLAGVTTAALDGFKGASGVWLAKLAAPEAVWLHVLAPLMVILGHNYSIFLAERDKNGKFHLRGGAGGAPSVGGSFGLYPPTLLFVLPVAAFLLYFVGYASVATMSAPLVSTIIFIFAARAGILPWEYVAYGVLAEVLLMWSLRPNIKRLFAGTERIVGFRARKKPSNQNQPKSTAETGNH